MCNAMLKAKYLRSAFVLYSIHTWKCFSSRGSGGVFFSMGWFLLQIRALTELCLFTEAVKESVQLTQGTGVLLPYGHYIANANPQVWAHICSLFVFFSLNLCKSVISIASFYCKQILLLLLTILAYYYAVNLNFSRNMWTRYFPATFFERFKIHLRVI